MKLYLKRKFAAAHFLPGHSGACSHLHGHTWLVEVWLEGKVDHKSGMVVDFGEVKEVIDQCDHQLLNDILHSEYLPPTAENLVLYFLNEIPYVYRVRVWESDDACAEEYREVE